jgi:RNA polymerase sigma factor (sigma-70 family)
MSASDTHLLKQWQAQRNAEAFSELVHRYSGMVFSVCRRMLGDAALAEDVAQECFLELMQGRVRIRSSLGALLHTMAVRRCVDVIRTDSRRRRRETTFAEAQPTPVNLANTAERTEVLSHIDTAMETLPTRIRAVVIARFLEGQTHGRIASAIGVAESTVRYRADQGVSRIRASLKRKGVAVGASALTAALAQSSEAAPTTLTQTMGKLSLGGVTSATALSTILSSWMLKGAAIALIVGAFGVGYWASSHRQAGETETQSIIAATAFTIPATTAAPEPTPKAEVTLPAETPEGTQPALAKESEPGPKISIQGRVYDAETGEGVTGVRVQVSPSGGGPLEQSEPTGKDGAYKLLDVADGSYRVSVSDVKEYPAVGSNANVSITLKDGETRSGVDLALQRGVTVSGQVLDSKGRPVIDAAVGVKSTTLVNPPRAQSDEEGRFVVYIPKHGDSLMVQAHNEDAESETLRQPQDPGGGLKDVVLRLVLPKTASISGVVLTGDGDPMPKAQIHLYRKSKSVFIYGNSGKTDASGEFHLTKLAADEYAVCVYPENAHTYGSAEEYARVQLTQGEVVEGLEIIYGEKGGLAISGRVVDSEGKPVSGTNIRYYRGTSQTAHSGKDGSFRLTGLQEGPCTLMIEDQNYSRTHVTIEAGTEDAEIVLKERRTLSGRAVDAETGAPLQKYNRTYIMGEAKEILGSLLKFPTSVEDADGEFSIGKVNLGIITVAVWAPGYAFSFKNVEVLDGEDAFVEFQLQPTPAFEGVVTNEAGTPLADAKIYLSQIYGIDGIERAAIATTDQDGAFRFESLSPEMDVMAAYRSGYGINWIDPATTSRIILPKAGILAGRAEPGDIAFSDIMLNMHYPENSAVLPSYYLQLDNDGSFQLENLTPGLVEIYAHIQREDASKFSIKKRLHIESGKTSELFFPQIEPGSASISGYITAQDEAVSRAYVTLEQNRDDGLVLHRRMSTESDGRYLFEGLQEGEHVLRIKRFNSEDASDFVEDEIRLVLEPGETVTQDIALEPAW